MKHAHQLKYLTGLTATLLPGALVLFAVTACQKAAPVTDAVREVVVLPVQADTALRAVQMPAEIQPRFVTAMSFRVGGQVVERLVHLGDSVRKGQVVARLDPADSNFNAHSAQADLLAAKQHFAAAEQQWQRDTRQANEKLISALQLEQTQDAYAAAKAQLRSAESRAAIAENQSGYTRLVAEHDGVISAEQANTGDVLAPGQPVYSLAWSGALDVVAEASESQIARIHTGQPASITLTAAPDLSKNGQLHGRVREISPAADPQSRTFRVKVSIDNPAERSNPLLRYGMTANLAIQLNSDIDRRKEKNGAAIGTTIIPATALFHDGNRPAVWIVKSSQPKLELRLVTIGAFNARSVVLTSGVTAGEKIVVQGVHTLTAGETVKPVAPLHSEDFAL